jgi:predicted transcriptional regulator
MPRPKAQHPTERELDILQVLWARESATLGEICEALCRDREVAKTTVATLLKLMEDKALVERTPDRRWKAAVSRNSTRTQIVKGLMDKLFDGSAGRLVAHVLKAGSLTAGDLEELQKLLEQTEPLAKSKSTKS